MKTLKIMAIMFLFTFGLLNAVAAVKPASVMLREGLYAEEVEGNIDAAIKIYEQIINDESASRENVAQALYRQGMCCLKKKDDAGARAAFVKLTTDYADQTEVVEKVKPLLDDLMNYDTAALMPPETLVYVELGSPGEQIETLLSMLKGTPFENPLAAIGGGNAAWSGGGQKSPADIVAAMLNPSMMAEFKKIKGMAVGITGVTQNNNSPVVAVLYPGKSDALRGLIMMGLSMAGTPGQPIEGMQSINIQNVAGAVYDDKVIIVAQPVSQLQWCVKQYKGITAEPTLASSNKSFAKIGKKQRQKNALTVWANVDDAYAQIQKVVQNPQGLLQANAVADFNGIDEFIMTVSIEPNSLNCKADVLFKDGHHCLAYDMIRTPNINKAALEVVPSDAIAVASLAYSPANGVQADKVRTKIQNITGLDIGREIYANIEQVSVFAMPANDSSAGWDSLPSSVGLAITSHNPQQTRQILTTLLGTVNAMSGNQPSGPVDVNAGRFRIGAEGGKEMYCYMEQVGNATILSLNRGIVDASVAAVKNKMSICTAGPLAPAVSNLSPSTTKLVLVNVGGAIRLAGPTVNVGPISDEQRNQLNTAIEQLARAADRTTVEISTDEQINSFTLKACVTGIPPLNEVFGPASQIAGITNRAKAEAGVKQLKRAAAATIMPTATPPVIDGNEDDVWSVTPEYKITNVMYSPLSSPNDLSADFRALWDENNLYILVDVTDDVLVNDTRPDQWVTLPTGSTAIPWWYDDCVEVYIDADNSKSNQYGSDDAQYHFDWDRTSPTMGRHNEHGRMEGIEFAVATTEKGYRTEIKFPWVTLGKKPTVGASIGLDIHVNDDDDGGERDTKITWFDKRDTAWNNPRDFGNAELAGLLGWWKFDEAEGATAAADSSGNNHNGTLVGNAKWTQGKIGGAVDLDGKSGFVRIADKSAFDIGGQVTVACWVNIRSVPGEYTAIVTKGDNSWRLSTAQAQRKFHASVNDWQQLTLDGSIEVAPNEWHHVAVVYDGDELRIYVDGRLDADKPWKGGIGRNDFDVLIGENAQQKGRFFDGLIDDVRIYNYALKENDIMALFNEGSKQ